MITNYHYISLSTISWVMNQTKLTQIILKYKIYLLENNTWLDMFKLVPYSTFPGGWVVIIRIKANPVGFTSLLELSLVITKSTDF